MIGGKRHSTVTDFQDVLLVLKTLLTHKVNEWQKGRYLGGGEHNTFEVKEALDLFALGEEEIVRGGVVEEVMRQRNKGKRAMEFGRDFEDAEAGYDEEEEVGDGEAGNEEGQVEVEGEGEEEGEEVVVVAEESCHEFGTEGQVGVQDRGPGEGNDYGFIDLSAEELDSIQMNWCAWKGVTDFEVFSEGSDNGED